MKTATLGFVLALATQGTAPPPSTAQQQQQRQEMLTQMGLGNGAAEPLAPLKPGTTMILGRVVEAGSTSGVSGAVVTLSGAALGETNRRFTDGTLGGARRVAADSQGRFVFRDLPASSYTLVSSASGYVEGGYGETRVVQIRRSLDLIRSVEITDADKVVTVDIQMWQNGGIGGRVVDEVGEPMVGVPVTILARVDDWGGVTTQGATVVVTDDRGTYHADIVPGEYIVGVLAATTTFPVSAAEAFQQALSAGSAVLTPFLNQAREANSLIARGPGVRVGNSFVSQIDSRNSAPVPSMFAVDGQLMLYPSTFHSASMTAVSALRVTVTSGAEKSGIDVQMRPLPARRVSGRVTGPDGPASGIVVMLVGSDPSVTRTSPATLIDTPRAVADANGEFIFVGIAPGNYTLRAFRQTSIGSILWAAGDVTVASDSDAANLQVVLRPGARIAGHIVVEGNAPLPSAPSLAQAPIVVTPRALPGSVGSFIGPLRPALVQSADMRFSTGENVPGPYMMTSGAFQPGWILKSITLDGQNVADKPFELSPGGVTDMIVTITNQISTIDGTVRDSNGQPSPKATVVVFPADKSLWRLPGMASRRVQTTAPGRDGRYTFRGLPAGDYIVVASDWPSADFSDGSVLTALTPSGERVTITGSENRTQDLRVVVKR